MFDLQEYPCPVCGEHQLVSDGIVRWRHGPEPPRSMARKRSDLAVTHSADFDETAFYHCAACNTNFVDRIVSSYQFRSLKDEGTLKTYYYDRKTRTWSDRRNI